MKTIKVILVIIPTHSKSKETLHCVVSKIAVNKAGINKHQKATTMKFQVLTFSQSYMVNDVVVHDQSSTHRNS